MQFTIESIRPGDEEQRHELRRQAFNVKTAFDPNAPEFDPDKTVAAYAGDRLLGTVVTLDFDQCFGAGTLPCGGVSGVFVAVDARGHGIARAMLDESFDRMRRRGQPVASLLPTTASLYRSTGFEVAGRYESSAFALTGARADKLDRWEPVELGDPRQRAIVNDMARRQHGWITYDDELFDRIAHECRVDTSQTRFSFLGFRGDRPVATVTYRYTDAPDPALYDLAVEFIGANDGDALAATFGFLAANGTTAGKITTDLPRQLLATALAEPQRAITVDAWPWMLRLVDVADSMTGRTWSAALDARLELDVVDPVLPHNAGRAVLAVADGVATWEPGGAGTVRVTVQDLASIYSGFTDPGHLAGMGRLGDAADVDVQTMRALFAGHPMVQWHF